MSQGKKTDWFKTWFNTLYYHLLYQNRDEKEAREFMNRLCTELQLPMGANILDVGCGKGRHANYLHSLGFNVTGIDLSENSIAEAKSMEVDGFSYSVHDMRMPFANDEFDCVLNLFTSIGYFENLNDNAQTVKACTSALKEKGLLVIDFLNAERVIQKLVPQEFKQVGNLVFEIERVVQNDRIIKKIKVVDNDQTYHFEERVSVLALKDFEAYFSDSGMELINLFGNYNLEHFNHASSERLIMIARKT